VCLSKNCGTPSLIIENEQRAIRYSGSDRICGRFEEKRQRVNLSKHCFSQFKVEEQVATVNQLLCLRAAQQRS
jgi:hypothetical protein